MVFLQDTHLTAERTPYFNTLWNGTCFHSYFSSQSRGTSILLNSNLQYTLIDQKKSECGNYIAIVCSIEDARFLFMNIYDPNEDGPKFYEELKSQMSQFNVVFIILGGDLNFVMNPALDSLNYVADNNTRAKEAFRDLCYSFNLVDVWRHYNPNDRKYTWLRWIPFKAGRLDMFFVSEDLVHNLFDIDITPGYRTDHSAITMSIKRKHKRGCGLWKINISHLSDDNYIKTIRSCIIDTIRQYAVPLYTEQVFSDHKMYESLQLTTTSIRHYFLRNINYVNKGRNGQIFKTEI